MQLWLLVLLAAALPDTLTLSRARDLFLKRNPELQAARLSRHLAAENLGRSAGSLFLPHLQVSYQYQRLETTPSLPSFFAQEPHALSVSLEQTLWSNPYLSGALDRWLAYRQAREQERQSRNQLLLGLYQAFFEGVEAQEAVRLAALQVRRARETLDLVRQKEALGAASRVEVLQAQLQWQQARLDSLQAVGRLREAWQNLARMLGAERPPDTWTLVPDTTLPDTAGLLQNLQARLHRHPEMRQALLSLQQKRWGFWFTLLSFLPSVKYGITWSYGGEAFPTWNRFRDDHTRTRGWYVALVFPFHTYPFDVALQRTAWRLAEVQARAAWLQRWNEVQTAWNTYETAREGLHLAETAWNLASESFRLARAQYREGLISEVELLNAQAQLKQAEVQRIQAQTRYRLSLYTLKLAVGEDLP